MVLLTGPGCLNVVRTITLETPQTGNVKAEKYVSVPEIVGFIHSCDVLGHNAVCDSTKDLESMRTC